MDNCYFFSSGTELKSINQSKRTLKGINRKSMQTFVYLNLTSAIRSVLHNEENSVPIMRQKTLHKTSKFHHLKKTLEIKTFGLRLYLSYSPWCSGIIWFVTWISQRFCRVLHLSTDIEVSSSEHCPYNISQCRHEELFSIFTHVEERVYSRHVIQLQS